MHPARSNISHFTFSKRTWEGPERWEQAEEITSEFHIRSVASQQNVL